MSLERRLRDGLARSAQLLTPDADQAFQAVTRNAEGRRRRATGYRYLAVAAGLAVLVASGVLVWPLLTAGVIATPADPVAPLVGRYAVEMPEGLPTTGSDLAGSWVITLGDDGSLGLEPPPGTAFPRKASYEVVDDLLRTDVLVHASACQATEQVIGDYRWRLSGSELRFTLVSDSCPAREALLTASTWRRLP